MSTAHSSLPLRSGDPRRVCLIRLPKLHLGPRKREFLVYFAGALFAFGWWSFLDATISSKYALPISDPDSPYDPIPVRVSFADWTPGLCATLGMIIVNLIDKSQLMSDEGGAWSGGWSEGGIAWRARLFLFVGFALMAGGLAGSITVLVIKYMVPHYPGNFGIPWGVANVIQSITIMFSAVVLWVAQSSEEYGYEIGL
ncbi:Vps68p [Sporobolomyces salmoneus]|uniref:Vps68p n=1 Tax=Sporobolomyces salmoneus TaxID=183962 RepID=UPI00317EA45E